MGASIEAFIEVFISGYGGLFVEATPIHYGFIFPAFDALLAVDYVVEAEKAGWDSYFVSETPRGIDAWVTLAVAAVRTQTIRLGTMLSPIILREFLLGG